MRNTIPVSVRIGIIKSNFFPSGGGSERYTNGLVEGLRGRGHEVHILAAQWDPGKNPAGVVVGAKGKA